MPSGVTLQMSLTVTSCVNKSLDLVLLFYHHPDKLSVWAFLTSSWLRSLGYKSCQSGRAYLAHHEAIKPPRALAALQRPNTVCVDFAACERRGLLRNLLLLTRIPGCPENPKSAGKLSPRPSPKRKPLEQSEYEPCTYVSSSRLVGESLPTHQY